MTVTINGTSGITTPGVNSTGSNVLGDNVADTLNVGNGAIVTDSSGNVGIGTSSPTTKLTVYDASTPVIKLATSASGTSATDGFDLLTAGSTAYIYNRENGPMLFATNNTEAMRIDSNGNLLVGKSSPDFGTAGSIFQPSGECDFTKDSNPAMYVNRLTNDGYLMLFYGQSVNRGGIAVSGSTIQYNSFSDYRLKENIQPMTGALEKVAQLNPVTYTWKADGSDGQGFIAHELQAVIPDAVNGEKDAVDAEGKPVYQGIDTSFLVATLTKAIQELSAKNDALEARITALEAK